MDKAGLEAIVRDGLDYPHVLGQMVCNIGDNHLLVQTHHDGRKFSAFWSRRIGHLRCTICVGDPEDEQGALVQIDIHDDGDVRVEAGEPLGVTVSRSENLICLTRYTPDGMIRS